MMYSLASFILYAMICLLCSIDSLTHTNLLHRYTVQSLTSSTGGAVVVDVPTVGAKVDDEETTKLSAALSHEAFTMFSCSETKKAVAKLLISLNDGGTSLKEFTSNWVCSSVCLL